MVKTGFSQPVLHDYRGDLKKRWYVSFVFTDSSTGRRKRFQYRMNINDGPTKMDRYDAAKPVLKLLTKALENGWNPFYQDIATFLQEIKQKELSEVQERTERQRAEEEARAKQETIKKNPALMPFAEALTLALERKRKGVKPKSFSSYKTVKEYASEALKKLDFAHIAVGEVKRSHIVRLLDQMQEDRQAAYDEEKKGRQFTGNNYNKYREFLHGLFAEIELICDLDFNPCHKIAKKPEIRFKPHRHATRKEEILIKKTLRNTHIPLYVFMAIEELAELRPNEICGLRINDIDKFNQWFRLDAADAKTRQVRYVPIPNTLMKILDEHLELDGYPKDYFIFSNGSAMTPGTTRLRGDKPGRLYKKIIKDELGVNVTLYSFKGLGGDKKIAAGIDKAAVSAQMGHTTLAMTDRYLEREEERKRRVIVELTPAFE